MAATTERTTRRGRAASPIRLLQATTFVSTLDRFAMPPMLMAIAHDLGVPLSEVVNAAGAYFLVYGLSQPVWGTVSDRFGRVRTMRFSLLVAGVFTILSATTGTPLLLGIARGLAGGFFGAAYPASLIYVGDTVPAEHRQRDVARLMVGVAMGTALASAGAGVLASTFTWRASFVVTGVASLLLVLVLRSLPEPAADVRPSFVASLRAVGRSPVTLLVLLLAFAEGAVLLGGLTLLPAAVESSGAGAALAGGVTAVYGVAVFGASQLVGRLAATWHPWRLIAIGAVAAAAGCVLLAVSQEPGAAVAVAVLLGLAWVSMHSSIQTWATEVLPEARATVMSFFAGSLFVGSAVAALAVAGPVDDGRYSVVFLAYAVLAVPLGVAAAVGRWRWHRPDPAAA